MNDAAPDTPLPPRRLRFGELLVHAGVLTQDQLRAALHAQRGRKIRLGELLIEDGVLDEVTLATVLSAQLDLHPCHLDEQMVAPEVVGVVPRKLVNDHNVFPVVVAYAPNGELSLYLAMADPTDERAVQAVRLYTRGHPVIPVVATLSAIKRAIARSEPIYLALEAPIVDDPPAVVTGAAAATEPQGEVLELGPESVLGTVVEPEAPPQPMVQEPMVQEPMVQEPMVQEPMVQEPMVQEPMTLSSDFLTALPEESGPSLDLDVDRSSAGPTPQFDFSQPFIGGDDDEVPSISAVSTPMEPAAPPAPSAPVAPAAPPAPSASSENDWSDLAFPENAPLPSAPSHSTGLSALAGPSDQPPRLVALPTMELRSTLIEAMRKGKVTLADLEAIGALDE